MSMKVSQTQSLFSSSLSVFVIKYLWISTKYNLLIKKCIFHFHKYFRILTNIRPIYCGLSFGV